MTAAITITIMTAAAITIMIATAAITVTAAVTTATAIATTGECGGERRAQPGRGEHPRGAAAPTLARHCISLAPGWRRRRPVTTIGEKEFRHDVPRRTTRRFRCNA